MKKILIVLIVLSMLAVATIPAMAAKGGKQKFELAGTITAIDTTAKTITVHVVQANKKAKSYKGLELTIYTLVDTKYFELTPDGRLPKTFEDLLVGQAVRVKGYKLLDAFYTYRVVYGVHLPEGKQ